VNAVNCVTFRERPIIPELPIYRSRHPLRSTATFPGKHGGSTSTDYYAQSLTYQRALCLPLFPAFGAETAKQKKQKTRGQP
jgi:hypothetical protein